MEVSDAGALPPLYWPLGQGVEPSGRDSLAGRPIGHDEGTFLVVEADDTVISIDPSGHYSTTYVNRNEKLFWQSLELARREWSARRDLNDASADAQVVEWRQRLSEIDPTATADRGTWWSSLLEQCEQGLL